MSGPAQGPGDSTAGCAALAPPSERLEIRGAPQVLRQTRRGLQDGGWGMLRRASCSAAAAETLQGLRAQPGGGAREPRRTESRRAPPRAERTPAPAARPHRGGEGPPAPGPGLQRGHAGRLQTPAARGAADPRGPRGPFLDFSSLRALHPGRTGCRAALAPEAGEGTSEASKPCAAGVGAALGAAFCRRLALPAAPPQRTAPAAVLGVSDRHRLGALHRPAHRKSSSPQSHPYAISEVYECSTNRRLLPKSHALPLHMNHQQRKPTRPATTTTAATEIPAIAPAERLGSLPVLLSPLPPPLVLT